MYMLFNYTQLKCQKCHKVIQFEPGLIENLDFKCNCIEEVKPKAKRTRKKKVEVKDEQEDRKNN